MKVREIMTANPACCTPDTSAREAASLMQREDCGCIPVVEDEQSNRLVGVVTDRDLALRGFARGMGPDTPVRELMSDSVSSCTPESDVDEVERIMSDQQVRRVPVVDDDGRCTGMIAQADLAREALQRRLGEDELARVVERVSEPNRSPDEAWMPASGAAAAEAGDYRRATGGSRNDLSEARARDERQDSIRQGIGVPEESPTGKAAAEARRRRAAKGPRIGGAMGGTSDAESPGDESSMNRAMRDAERWRSEPRGED